METSVIGLGVKILFAPNLVGGEHVIVAGWVFIVWLALWLTSLIVGYLPGADRKLRRVSWITFGIFLLIGIATPQL